MSNDVNYGPVKLTPDDTLKRMSVAIERCVRLGSWPGSDLMGEGSVSAVRRFRIAVAQLNEIANPNGYPDE